MEEVGLGPAESGIVLRGDQRASAVADFDGDGRSDLAVGQNRDRTTLWRNSTATPGVRVRLDGGALNPRGFGARIRIEGSQGPGPGRWVVAGSGHWSTDGTAQVLARPAGRATVVVRWPDGRETRLPIAPGTSGVTAAPPSGGR